MAQASYPAAAPCLIWAALCTVVSWSLQTNRDVVQAEAPTVFVSWTSGRGKDGANTIWSICFCIWFEHRFCTWQPVSAYCHVTGFRCCEEIGEAARPFGASRCSGGAPASGLATSSVLPAQSARCCDRHSCPTFEIFLELTLIVGSAGFTWPSMSSQGGLESYWMRTCCFRNIFLNYAFLNIFMDV